MSLCFSYEFQNDVIFGLCAMVTTLNWPNNMGDKLSKKINEIIFPADLSLSGIVYYISFSLIRFHRLWP